MFTLDLTSPHYLQIYENIKNEIISGRMEENHKLPSIRGLAALLNISTTPVELAYQQLQSEGFVESRPRAGFFVQSLPKEYLLLGNKTDKSENPPSNYPSRDAYEYEYDFHISKIDLLNFPIKVWGKIYNEVLIEGSMELDYGNPQGEEGLRKELVGYLKNFRGVHCSPEQIIIAGDQTYLINLLSIILRENGFTQLSVEDPGYRLIPATFQKMGYSISPIQLSAEGINIEYIRNSDTKLIAVTPSYQFPTGKTLSRQGRLTLLNWARNVGGYIIEDDYDGEFNYYKKPLPSLQGLENNNNVIYLGGFSQVLAPALSIHYMILPRPLLDYYNKIRIELMLEQSSSRLHQKTLQLFIERGYLAKHIRKLRKLYKDKHDKLLSSLDIHLGDKITIIGKGSGFHVLVSVHDSRSAHELVSLAKCSRVRVINGDAFYWTDKAPSPPSIMIGFTGVPMDLIDNGIQTLSRAWFS